MNDMKLFTPAEADLEKLKSDIQNRMKHAILTPPSGFKLKELQQMNSMGEKMRNAAVWDFRLVRQAVFAFIELAATRDWTVSGKPGAVSKTVETINNVSIWDLNTGYVQRSFEQHLRRRALDYVTVGRHSFGTRNIDDPANFVFEYLDPTKLYWNRQYPNRDSHNRMPPVGELEKIWSYGTKSLGKPDYAHREVHIGYAIPIGENMDRFIAPLMLVYSTALLAWLIEQHDTTALDGRKIRDIFLVDKGLFDPLIQAIAATLNLWSGADPSKTGLPIVEASVPINGNLQDRIAQLGLSKIPEAFDRAKFEHSFANDIAGALGLALRHFWQDDSNTNRALEEVQESRQQSKGPLAFVRMEERLINNSPIVRVFATEKKPCHFAFIEETDTSRMKDEAQALSMYAKGLADLTTALGGINLDPIIILTKAQELGWLPQDMPVADMILKGPIKKPTVETGGGEVSQGSVQASPAQDEVSAGVGKSLQKLEEDLDYDDVIMNSKGIIVASRQKVYSVAKILRRELEGVEI